MLFALLHASGVLPIGVLQRLDDIIYDARLRATMPRTLDERIVIVDLDEKSLAEVGRWPWGRNRMAELVDELFDRQKIALVGFDIVFAEPDESSGLKRLRQLAQAELKDQPGFTEKLGQLQASLDYDAAFAKSLQKRPVVMGYYLTNDKDGRTSGLLPEPVMQKESLRGRPIRFTTLEQLWLQHRAAGQGRADGRLLQFDRGPRRRGAIGAAGGAIQGPVLRVAGAGDVQGPHGTAVGGAAIPARGLPVRDTTASTPSSCARETRLCPCRWRTGSPRWFPSAGRAG